MNGDEPTGGDVERDERLEKLRRDLPLAAGADRGALHDVGPLFAWWAQGVIGGMKQMTRLLRSGQAPSEGWLNTMAEACHEFIRELERGGATFRGEPAGRVGDAGGGQ